MKTKKFSKKLRLSKETVANLNSNQMRFVYGGIDTKICPLPTEHSLCCTINGPTCTCFTYCEGTCQGSECDTCP
ncbi:MAG: class I lanthipeptide [Candidatus Aminicenantes bacterium]|nr:MAG: class I lanthipeptide [Candidatus Aminicenantes bacterium]